MSASSAAAQPPLSDIREILTDRVFEVQAFMFHVGFARDAQTRDSRGESWFALLSRWKVSSHEACTMNANMVDVLIEAEFLDAEFAPGDVLHALEEFKKRAPYAWRGQRKGGRSAFEILKDTTLKPRKTAR